MFKKSLIVILLIVAGVVSMIGGTTYFISKIPPKYTVNIETNNRWPLFPVCDRGKWGYINSDGEYIIAPQFDFACNFDDEDRVAKVCLKHESSLWRLLKGSSSFRYGTYAYIDECGRVISNSTASTINSGYFFNGQGIAVDGDSIYDKTGAILYRAKTGFKIEGNLIDDRVPISNEFSDHFPRLKGYSDKRGEVVIPCRYDSAGDFKNGLAKVSLNENYGLIDTDGHEVTPLKYNDIFEMNSDGLTLVEVDGHYGYINTQGEECIPLIYEDASPFSEGLAPVKLNGQYGFINIRGEMVIPPQYQDAQAHQEGLAVVQQEGLYGYIDKNGTTAVPLQYEKAYSFCEGVATAQQNGRYILIDSTGAPIIKDDFAEVEAVDEGMIWVQKNAGGFYGCIDLKGHLICPYQFEKVNPFHNGLAAVNYERGQDYFSYNEYPQNIQYINKNGEVVWPKQ